MVLGPGPEEFANYKDSYGYVEAIAEAEPNDTGSPLCVSVILKRPCKYGHISEEWKSSCAWVRIDAFASKCDAAAPYLPPNVTGQT